MQPGVRIYTSNRLEDLLEVLAERLAADPLPPLRSETIVVPGQGIARWLRFGLASRHGIAAGLALPFPGALLQRLDRAGGGLPDRFAPDVLTLRIHRLLADPAHARRLGPAARYCDDDPDGRKRLQLSQRLAACFDDYQLYRADLLERAAAGDDLADCGPHGAWQARLWRTLLADAGLGAGPGTAARRPARGEAQLLFPELADGGPAQPASWQAHRLQSLERLLDDPDRAAAALPPRLSVFGTSTLPPALLAKLLQIGRRIPVTLYVPTPSPLYFGDLSAKDRADGSGNALLARLGTEAREFQDLLVDLTEAEPVERHDLGALPAGRPPNLLAMLHRDLAHVGEHGAAGLPRFGLAPDDDSVRVHDCHSEHRELEVVRDQILAAFAGDPQLQPHDVLVLVPDIERYSPYVHAVFGPVQGHLPYQVADKSPAAELPICAAVFRTLRLAQGRLPVHDVLHLLETPAVQRRFGLFASDLPVLAHLCERAGIRWGLDGETRGRRFAVPAFDDNTWRLGIERMLIGAATGPVDDLVLDRLPVADATASRESLLERFLAFVEVLVGALRPLQRTHPLADWADRIDGLVAELFSTDAEDDAGIAAMRAATAELRAAARLAGHTEPVAAVVAEDWLRGALGRAAGSHGFLGGRVTVAAMLPMRAVPVRCLFLCGLDDRSFPRSDAAPPFDLAARSRRAGDRGPRLDDRQLFLDCILAARDKLHVTFVGHSQKDDSECAPSVVLSELVDAVDRACTAPAGFERAGDWLRVRHPLHAWSPRYRSGDDPRLFTYATAAVPSTPAATSDEQPWVDAPISPAAAPATGPIELDDLLDFWWHPCRFFLRRGLGIWLARDSDADTTTESFALNALDHWRLLDSAVRRALDGRPQPRDPAAHARATGLLPAGGSGIAAFAQVHEEQEQFLGELGRRGALRSRAVTVTGADFTVAGELPHVGHETVVYARAAKIKPKDRLRSWVLHVVAAAARGQGADVPATTTVIARDKTVRYRELARPQAEELLADLVAGLRDGMREPLPFFEGSSHEFGQSLHRHPKDPAGALRKARRKWLPDSSDFAGSDSEDHAVALCMRGRDALGLPEFAAWAARIWRPLYGYAEDLK